MFRYAILSCLNKQIVNLLWNKNAYKLLCFIYIDLLFCFVLCTIFIHSWNQINHIHIHLVFKLLCIDFNACMCFSSNCSISLPSLPLSLSFSIYIYTHTRTFPFLRFSISYLNLSDYIWIRTLNYLVPSQQFGKSCIIQYV